MSQLDGFLARKYRMTSILGTVLDPAADKALIGTLVVTLTMQGLLPCELSAPEDEIQFSCPT
jgi:cardiolipin synthase (CMP-forming)